MAEPDRILRIRTVLQRTGLSRSTLYRKIQDGSFPRQVQISIHGAGWRESAINRWIADPAAYRMADGARKDLTEIAPLAIPITGGVALGSLDKSLSAR